MAVSYPPRQVESDAEKMINSLFQEIDQTLQIDSRFPSLEGRGSKYFSLPPSQEISPSDFDQTHRRYLPGEFPTPASPPTAETFNSKSEPRRPKPSPLWLRHLDKIIFSSSCVLFVGSLLLLEKDHQFPLANFQQLQSSMSISNEEIQKPIEIDTTPQFLNYMEQALGEIEREQKLAEKIASSPKQPPQPPIAPSPEKQPPQLAESSAKEQSSQVAVKSSQTKPVPKKEIAALPALPPPPPVVEPSPSPKTNTTPTEAPEAVSPTPVETETSEEPAAPPTPTPDPATNELPEASQKPQQSHTLVGLLDLGGHSAVLLQVEGTTQRVMLEETIPGSNWKLVSVKDQQAIFESGQQQKVMYVGEKMSVQ